MNKQERNIIFCLLLSGGIFVALGSPSTTFTDKSTDDCRVFKIESHILYFFVDPRHHKGLRFYRDEVCQRVKDGRWSLEKANKFLACLETRCGICRGWSVNPSYEEFLKKQKSPDSVILAHQKFCRDTYKSNVWAYMNIKDTPKRVEWLQVEIFCGWTHFIAKPGGWLDVFKPDVPSFKRLEERSDSLCEDLRSGKIPFDEAIYRWKLEILEFEKNVRPDAVRWMFKNLKAPIDNIIKLIKKK